LAELESLKINVKKLYLDRGFFNTPVIRWLQALDIPFMMPAIKTGKKGGIKTYKYFSDRSLKKKFLVY
jgi:putative transposase